MKTNNLLKESPFIGLFLLPWIIILSLGDNLPKVVPSHYSPSSHGWVVDSYMAPVPFTIIFSIAMLIVYIAMTITPKIYVFKLLFVLFLDAIVVLTLLDSMVMKSDIIVVVLTCLVNGLVYYRFKTTDIKPLSEKYYNIVWFGSHCISSIPLLFVIFSAQNWLSQRLIPEAIFLFLAVLGNLTQNLKPNFFVGIRTPWTLRSEDVWRTTHRVCAKWLFAGGILGFVISIFAPLSWLQPMILIFTLSFSAYAFLYSYITYRRQNPHLP